jgi:hypothetical protein
VNDPLLAAMKASRLSLVSTVYLRSNVTNATHEGTLRSLIPLGKPLPDAAEPRILPVTNVKNVKPRVSRRCLPFI